MKNNQRMNPLTAIDLFCGCGGLTQGLKEAGFKVLGAVDIDPLSVETFKKNHSDVFTWELDIKRLSVSTIKKVLGLRNGELDVLAGSPPCQGFSTMRTLNGSRKINDPRNDLIVDFMRIVKGLKPKTILLENVPGLAKDYRFKTFCRSLVDLGYKINHLIIDAADFGVPQRRKRLILLAGEKGSISLATPVARTTVFDAIYYLPVPGKSGDKLHDLPEKRSEKVKELIKKIPKNGGSRTELHVSLQLDCHKRCNGFKDVYGRMSWNDVSPTITSGCTNPSKGRFIHPSQDRAITLREAALLQSFPKTYFFSTSKGKQGTALLIGNALPPKLIYHQACVIKEYILRDPG